MDMNQNQNHNSMSSFEVNTDVWYLYQPLPARKKYHVLAKRISQALSNTEYN